MSWHDRYRRAEGILSVLYCPHAVQAVFKYTAQLPPQVAAAKLQRLMAPLLATGAAAGADSEVAHLLSAAFETHQYSIGATLPPPQATGDSNADAAQGTQTSAAAVAAGNAASSSSRAGEGRAAAAGEAPFDEGLLGLLQQHALAAVGKLRDNMRGASLVTLPPGE